MKLRKQESAEAKDRAKEGFRTRIAEASELPKDVVLGLPILTMLGRTELSVENYRGILEYTDTLVRIQTKIGQIRVLGKNIQVVYYTNDEMKIHGSIDTIEYHR